jgi:Transcription factor TFIID (or TATA-binding protein, TBP)
VYTDAPQFTKLIHKIGQDTNEWTVDSVSYKVTNIVATVNVGFCIKLELLSSPPMYNVYYEPEMFSGAICTPYPSTMPKVKVIVHHSGKIVITGTTDMFTMYRAFFDVYPWLQIAGVGTNDGASVDERPTKRVKIDPSSPGDPSESEKLEIPLPIEYIRIMQKLNEIKAKEKMEQQEAEAEERAAAAGQRHDQSFDLSQFLSPLSFCD